MFEDVASKVLATLEGGHMNNMVYYADPAPCCTIHVDDAGNVICTRIGDGCFAEDTRIQTPEGWAPIQTIVPGQEVLCWDEGGGRLVVGKVIGTSCVEDSVYGEVRLVDGTVLNVTSHHRLAVGEAPDKLEWMAACELAPRSRIWRCGPDGMTPMEVDAVGKFEKRAAVYNLSTTRGNYFAEGMLVLGLPRQVARQEGGVRMAQTTSA